MNFDFFKLDFLKGYFSFLIKSNLIYVILVIAITLIILILRSRRVCRHEWQRRRTWFHFDSNVIETIYVCKKCGKIRHEYRPR